MMAEIWARQEGICRGMGGSMHVADIAKGILGANGIVGAGLAIAAGAAFGAWLDGDGNVAGTSAARSATSATPWGWRSATRCASAESCSSRSPA